MVGLLVLLLVPIDSSSTDKPVFAPTGVLAACSDLYYNFEFEQALACARKADAGSARTSETAYWHSKVLWVYQLDTLLGVNDNLIAMVLEKEPTRKPISPLIRTEFLDTVNAGLALARGTTQRDRYFAGALLGNKTAWDLLLEGRKVAALNGVKQTMATMRSLLLDYPQTVDAFALLGMGNYLMGTNPWYIKMVSFVMGVSGDRDEGVLELKTAADAGVEDALFLYKGVLVREGRIGEAIDLLKKLLAQYPRNVFYVIESADLLARVGRVSEARARYVAAKQLIDLSPELTRRFGPMYLDQRLARLPR
jgi:tetratricopeptide (TPR) repeat protein